MFRGEKASGQSARLIGFLPKPDQKRHGNLFQVIHKKSCPDLMCLLNEQQNSAGAMVWHRILSYENMQISFRICQTHSDMTLA